MSKTDRFTGKITKAELQRRAQKDAGWKQPCDQENSGERNYFVSYPVDLNPPETEVSFIKGSDESQIKKLIWKAAEKETIREMKQSFLGECEAPSTQRVIC